MPVTRVVVASESRITGSVMEELFVIRSRFLAAEDSKDVHAAVLYANGWFVIWIEGPEDGIEAVLRRSALDQRHAHLRIIHRGQGPRTLAERVTLASTQGADRPFEFARRIHAVETASSALEPATIWRRLGAPWTLGDAADLSGPACRPVALLGSDDSSILDLLRRLGERYRRGMVYQRFANEQRGTRDVGAAYVDLPIAGCATRVQALPRRAIEHVMLREVLLEARVLAFIVGPRPRLALELAEMLAGLVGEGAALPAIHVVAESPVIGYSVAEVLRKANRDMPAEVVQPGPSQMVDFILGLAQRDCGPRT